MALRKQFTLPSGVTADYIKITDIRWHRSRREALVVFGLFVSETASESGAQPVGPVFKLRLVADKFDYWLGNETLSSELVLRQAYLAAKTEPLVSDFGPQSLADAEDV